MRLTVVVGSSRAARAAAVREIAGHDQLQQGLAAAQWPFERDPLVPHGGPVHSDRPLSFRWFPDLHEAFPAWQMPGTRLVLTQSTYQLQRCLDWLDRHPGAAIVADAPRAALTRCSPELIARRGPWSRLSLLDLGPDDDTEDQPTAVTPVQAAFRQRDADQRHAVCLDAVRDEPGNAALHLACASAAMERLTFDAAHESLEQARALAPDWEAVHFEFGKLWLRADDTERASEAFAEAGRLMPGFAAAFGNLGAALGELDRPEAALAALEQALRYDPAAHTVVNNMGAVWRDTGELDQAEAAFRRVLDLQPSFVFGYFNLAHTLLLAGRFAESRDMYAAGMQRDPQKNARQALRLCVARAAAGDTSDAIEDVRALADRVPVGVMRDLIEEAESTLRALSAVPGVDQAGVARVIEALEATLRS